jgi:transcriptional regulator with XRE-family HTH domain
MSFLPEQCRAARALLDWTQIELAHRSGVSRSTDRDFEGGMYQPAIKARMDDFERQKAEIMARMAETPADVSDIHPNIAEIYKAKVVHLTEALPDQELHSEAVDAIRSLVGEVVLTPGEKRGAMQAVLRGELMGILDFVAERRSHSSPEDITKGVARPRNQ